jgi:hypothetical protein
VQYLHWKRLKIVSVVKSAIAIVSAGILAASAIPANAANAPKPKVGQCFNYTKSDLERDSPAKKAAVSCSKSHNVEVYRVASYTYKESPFSMSSSDLWSIANEACQPWRGNVAKTKFNYWFFFIPTRTQWAAGERWIRCDAAMANIDSKGKVKSYKKWKGKKLDIR